MLAISMRVMIDEVGSAFNSCNSMADISLVFVVFFVALHLRSVKTLYKMNIHRMLTIVFILSPKVMNNFVIIFKSFIGHTFL